MHQPEAVDLERCVSCGVEFDPARDRGYTVDADDALCLACALARGGQYDERRDRWLRPPNVVGLPLARST